MVQHFAAGVVFAVTAGELLPELKGERNPAAPVYGYAFEVIVGFALGLAVMLG